MSVNSKKHNALSHEAIVKALFESYESIYAVDVGTSAFQCFHESNSYSSLRLEDHGDNFFDALESNMLKKIYIEDQEFAHRMLSKEALCAGLSRDKFYTFVFRLMIDGQPLYHKLRATKELVEGRPHFLIGIRNVDAVFRQDKELAEKLTAMHSKELSHLDAILASAEGYLEVNLTTDTILDHSPYNLHAVLPDSFRAAAKNGTLPYSTFMKWHAEHMVTVSKDCFIKISDRSYLMKFFEKGEKRASASFSIKAAEGQMQPHFLYNTLGTIQEIVLSDPVYASELIGDFSIHLRSCIRAMANDAPLPFDQELANIKAYVNIEKMRFGDKLNVLYNIRFRDFFILPFSVQPLVENAIRHGIYERGEQGGLVVIQTEKKEDTVQITVEDNGVGFDVEKFQTDLSEGRQDSTGLKNVIFRLDKMMHAKVKIESEVGIGTTVIITVPDKENTEQ